MIFEVRSCAHIFIICVFPRRNNIPRVPPPLGSWNVLMYNCSCNSTALPALKESDDSLGPNGKCNCQYAGSGSSAAVNLLNSDRNIGQVAIGAGGQKKGC